MIMTPKQATAVLALADVIEETARDSMPMGAPSGVVYAALMGVGVTLNLYQQILAIMVKQGRITVEHDCIKALLPEQKARRS